MIDRKDTKRCKFAKKHGKISGLSSILGFYPFKLGLINLMPLNEIDHILITEGELLLLG